MRNVKTMLAAATLTIALCGATAAAQDVGELPPPPAGHVAAPHEATLPYTHPVISDDMTWVGAMMIIVSGMFIAAMVIGPYVRSEMPEEVPVAHSHDEPPGTSHHHGPGGTVQPGPEHELPGGHAHGGH